MNNLTFIKDNIRWLLGGLLLTSFSSFGQTFFIALFSSEIRDTFNLTHGGFGLLYMVSTLASAATLVWLGKVVDNYSVSTVSTVVCVALALFCALMAFASNIVLLGFTLYGLRLFGQGMMTQTAMTAMGRWYSAQRGKAVSLTSMGYQLGEGAFPSVVVAMMLIFDWRKIWLLAACAVLFMAMPLIYSLMRKERIPRTLLSEQQIGQQQGHWRRSQVLSDQLFWVLCLGVLAPSFIGTSVFFHQMYFAESKGWSRTLIASAFPIMSVSTIVCGVVAGLLVDRFSAKHLLPWFLIPLGLGCVVISTLSNTATVPIYMMLLGVSYGISSTLFGAIWPEIYGTRHLGAIRAMVMAGMVFSSALGPGITGWLIDLGVSFDVQLKFMAVYCMLVCIVMWPVSRALLRRESELVQMQGS